MAIPSLPQAALAAIYCRVSDSQQSGIPAQRRWCRNRAAELRLSVVADLEDEGISGDDMERPGLLELEETFRRAHQAKRPIVALLVDQADRLSRADSIASSAMIERLRQYGLRWIITGTRVFDLRDAMDRTLLLIECDHKNNPFLRDIARKSLNGTIETALAGFWSGRVPFGYRLVHKPGDHPPGKRRKSGRLEEHPEQGPLVREIPLRYLSGESTPEIAKWLQARCPSPWSVTWTAQGIDRILRSRIYTGVRLLGKQARGKHAAIRDGEAVQLEQATDETLAAESVIRLVNAAPVLWDEATFAKIQARLAGGRRRNHRESKPPLPLALLGKCGHCEQPLHVARYSSRHGKREDRIYCGTRRVHGVESCPLGATASNHHAVLKMILATLAENLLEGDAVEKLAAKARVNQATAKTREDAERDAIGRRLAANERDTARTRERLASAPDDMIEEVYAALRSLKTQRESLETELRQIESAAGISPVAVAGEEELRRWLELCQRVCAPGVRLELPAAGDDGTLNEWLTELIAGFVLFWKDDPSGKGRVLDRVEVELPVWLNALLATNASLTCKQGIVLTAVF